MTTSARPQPLTAAAPKITMKHAGWVSSNSFDAIGVTYEMNSPIWFYKYFMSEANYGAISAAMIEAFGLLFQLTPAPVGGAHTVDAVDGFVYTIKPSMVATPAVTDLKLGGLAVGHEYHFAGGDAAAADWRKALTLLLKRGFKGVRKLSTDVVTKSLQTAMLEADFVEYMEILKPGESKPQVRIFWRCDSRGKDKFIDIDAAVARVDTKAEATNCNLTESWHPYSDPDINKMLWLRLNQKDNDYYTIVSVGTELRDCTAFPTLDENKAYTFPAGVDAQHIKPLKNWTLAELQTQKQYLVQASITTATGTSNRIAVCTKVYGYMGAFNSGVVIKTNEWGGKGGASFPERGIRGFDKNSVVAMLPMLRVHHGPGRSDGFTLFSVPTEPVVQLIDDAELKHRFGDVAAASIKEQLTKATGLVTGHLRTAWLGTGHADPSDASLKVNSIVSYPAPPVGAGDAALL